MRLASFQEERPKCCDSKCMVSATEIIFAIQPSTQQAGPKTPGILPSPCTARCRLTEGYLTTATAYIVTIRLVLLSSRAFPVSSAPIRDARTIVVYGTPERPERLLSGNCLQSIVQARLVPTVVGALPMLHRQSPLHSYLGHPPPTPPRACPFDLSAYQVQRLELPTLSSAPNFIVPATKHEGDEMMLPRTLPHVDLRGFTTYRYRYNHMGP